MLDDLHVALQTAFGWTDSHLHRFGVGEEIWDRDTELYLCPFDVEEGDDEGVPEAVSESTISEMSVATILRNACGVTHSKPSPGGQR